MRKKGARKGQWIFWIIALVAWFAPSQAHVYADDYSNGVVRFSYTSNHIRQQIDTENISDYSSLTFSVKARYGAYGPDSLYAEIALYDDAWSTLSTVRYPESGDITLLADYQVSTYTINPANAGLPSGIAWSDIKHIAVSVYGQDSESWGGNYGPIVDYVSLIGTKSDGTTYEKLTNHDFNDVTDNAPDNWTLYTYTAWDTCQGLYTSTLCVDRENAPYHTNYELSILDLCVNNIDDALVTKQSILSATGLNTEATFITAYNAGTWGVYIASGSGNFGEDYGNRPDVYCGNSQNNQPPNLDSNGGTKDYFWGGAGNDTVTQMWYSVFYGGYGDDTVSTLSEESLFYGEGGDDTCTLLQTSSICDLGADEETVIVAPYFNAVQNLTATANEDGSVNLAWDAPVASNTEIYGYSINFVDFDDNVERGGWGVWTEAANTTYSLGHWMFDGSNPVTTGYGPVRFKVYAMSGPCAGVGEGSCLYGPSTNADATVLDPTPPTTTTTTTTTTLPSTTTTTTEVPTTTTSEVPTTTTETPVTLPPDTVPESTIVTTPDTTDGGPDGGTGSPPDTTSPETTVPESAPEEETTTTTPDSPVEETPTTEEVIGDILSGDLSLEELGNAVSDALGNTDSEEELVSVASALLASDLTSEEFASVVAEVFSQDLSDDALTELVDQVFSQDLSDQEIAAVVDQVFTADISDEAFAKVLNTVFEKPLSDNVFNSVIDAILDEPISDAAFDELVDVLGGDSVTEEQVQSAVTSIIDNGITESRAVSIATSGEVLESITGDQASEIFAKVPISDITDEEAAALVEAVQDAPTEVKAAFESEIDIFSAGNVDTYVPIGSNVPVSTRRVIIAAAGLTMTMLPQPAPTPSSGGPVAATDNKNKNTGKRK